MSRPVGNNIRNIDAYPKPHKLVLIHTTLENLYYWCLQLTAGFAREGLTVFSEDGGGGGGNLTFFLAGSLLVVSVLSFDDDNDESAGGLFGGLPVGFGGGGTICLIQ